MPLFAVNRQEGDCGNRQVLNRLLSKSRHKPLTMVGSVRLIFDCAGDVMRLAGLALSAAFLSGCSYMGGMGQSLSNMFSSNGYSAAQAPYQGQGQYYGSRPSGYANNSAPYGTNSHAGGFPQKPQFGEPASYQQPQYATGSYGSHASGNIHTAQHQGSNAPRLRRPRFRGSLELGVEQSQSGNLLDYDKFPLLPVTGYDPDLYNESRTTGSIIDGQVTTREYFVDDRLRTNPEKWDDVSMPSISIDDAWSAPATVGFGGEFILNDRATLFGRVGYTRSEGASGDAASIEGTVFERTTDRFYDEFVLVGTTVGTAFRTGQTITEFSYDFSDMDRLDLEAGGRVYLNPVAGRSTGRTVTPFFGASAGASHYNDVSFTIDQRQLSYASVYEDETQSYYDLDLAGYDLDADPVTPATRTVDLYESQWVPAGSLNAGVEWQVTPKTALAFETGLRIEGAREYSNGEKGATNISVPLRLRGSFNF